VTRVWDGAISEEGLVCLVAAGGGVLKILITPVSCLIPLSRAGAGGDDDDAAAAAAAAAVTAPNLKVGRP